MGDVRCGICDIWMDVSEWEEHTNSEEHKNKIKNLGGIDAMLERHMVTTRIGAETGDMEMADKLAKQIDRKMERIITDRKSYDISHSDDFKFVSGYINGEGEWFSCDATDHEIFADDYLERFQIHLTKYNKKRLLNTIKQYRKDKTKTCKDFLIDRLGWVSITDGLTDVYITSEENGINRKQRITLKKWFLKFKKPFRYNGDVIGDEYHDFFQEVR